MKDSCDCGVVFSFRQTGSAFILMASFAGAMPSSVTVPVMLPAVAASTFCPSGVAAGADGSADWFEVPPPPQAATVAASVRLSADTQTFRKNIDLSWRKVGARTDKADLSSYCTTWQFRSRP